MAEESVARRVFLLASFFGLIGLLTYLEQRVVPVPAEVGSPRSELAYWQLHVDRNPKTPASRLRLGLAYAKNQKLEEAENSFSAALVLDSDYDAAAVGRYGALSGQGKQGLAIEGLARYAEGHHKCVVCWQNLAAEYLGLGQLRAARSAVGNLLASDFTVQSGMYSAGNLEVEAFLMAGRVFASGGDHSKAIGFFREAIAIDPKDLRAYLFQAKSLLAKGEGDAALAMLEEASDLAEGDESEFHEIRRLQTQARDLSARGRP